MMVIKFRC